MQLALPQHDRVARLRCRPDLVPGPGEGFREPAIEPSLRDRCHRIRRAARRAEELTGIAGDSDRLLGGIVPGREILVLDRPVDTASEFGPQTKVVGQEAQACAEPMPGRAADRLEIGALELVGTGLHIPGIEIGNGRMRSFPRHWVGGFRNLQWRFPKSFDRIRTVDARSGLQDRHPDVPRRKAFGEQRSGDAGPYDQHIRADGISHGQA
jgi:hypothetical protein